MNNINNINQLISNIKKILRTPEWLMPINFIEQRDKFISEEIDNPQFIYPQIPANELKGHLEQLNYIAVDPDNADHYFLSRRIEELKLKLKILLTRDQEDYFKFVNMLYPCKFDEITVSQAKIDSQFYDIYDQEKIVDANELEKIIREYLRNTYQINDWEITTIERDDFTVKLQPLYKKIFVSQNSKQRTINIESILAHEIDTHLIRAVNMHQQNGVLAKQFPFYLKTEEGLGCFLSDYCTQYGEISRKKHAAKYLAGITAKVDSFQKVYEQLVNYGLSPKLAFKRTFRLKRGLCDTSKPGVFTKEAMYYEGMLEVKKFIDENGDVNKLFAGKIGLEDVDRIKEYNEGILPKRLLRYSSYAK